MTNSNRCATVAAPAAQPGEDGEVRLVIRAESAITADEAVACDALWWIAFPPGENPSAAMPLTPRASRLLLFHGDTLVGVAGLRPSTISVANDLVQIAGLGGVAVHPTWRGQGLGSRIVAAFAKHAREAGYRWAILSCTPAHRAFYERLGWCVLTGDLEVREGDRRRAPLGLLMALPLADDAAERRDAWRKARIVLPAGEW